MGGGTSISCPCSLYCRLRDFDQRRALPPRYVLEQAQKVPRHKVLRGVQRHGVVAPLVELAVADDAPLTVRRHPSGGRIVTRVVLYWVVPRFGPLRVRGVGRIEWDRDVEGAGSSANAWV